MVSRTKTPGVRRIGVSLGRRLKPLPSRVLFVGAGFSAGMQYPVGRALPRCLLRYLLGAPETPKLVRLGFKNSLHAPSKEKNKMRRQLRLQRAASIVRTIDHFLRRYFGANINDIDKVDVAEFYTLAQSLADTPSLFGPQLPLPKNCLPLSQLYGALAAVTRTYFTDISYTIKQPPADINSLIQGLDPERDVIVNFNWDEELDFFLGEGWVVYSLAAWHLPRRHQRHLLLRPHGSVGWYDVARGLSNEDPFLIAEDDARIERHQKRIVSYADVELPIDMQDGRKMMLDCPPVVMPPTFAKRFEYDEQSWIWRDVIEVCQQAKRFVFLGYSLPPDDYLTRAAIRSALHTSSREEIRCLVVAHSFDGERSEPFKRVFGGGLSEANNFLEWDFGCGDERLPQLIAERLEAATIPPVTGQP